MTIPLFDRELSWLEFNRRVLGEAQNRDVPLLERVKFLAICANNLDEFLMIRVFDAVCARVRGLLADIQACWGDELLPALQEHGIRIESVSELSGRDLAAVEEFFDRNLRSILAPLALDPGHSPFIANLALHLAVRLESHAGEPHVVILRMPQLSPRL